MSLLCAKSKVSPYKNVTISRLALAAAVPLSRLVKHVSDVTDSTIVTY